MIEKNLDIWKKEILLAFQNGPPNGWLQGWDENRLKESFKQMVGEIAKVENCTSFDYSFCNKFGIKFPSGKDGYYLFVIRISFVLPTFSLHWTRYSGRKAIETAFVCPDIEALNFLEESVRSFLIGRKYVEFPDSWYDEKVLGVQLELAGKGPTIEKCLFEDYE